MVDYSAEEPVDQFILKEALKALSRRDYTQWEMKRFLFNRGYSNELSIGVLKFLRQKGYLNDEEYTRRYIRHASGVKMYGRERILRQLMARGIEEETVRHCLGELVSPELELQTALNIARRRLNQKKKSDYLARHLYRRGFTESTIYAVLEQIGDFRKP